MSVYAQKNYQSSRRSGNHLQMHVFLFSIFMKMPALLLSLLYEAEITLIAQVVTGLEIVLNFHLSSRTTG